MDKYFIFGSVCMHTCLTGCCWWAPSFFGLCGPAVSCELLEGSRTIIAMVVIGEVPSLDESGTNLTSKLRRKNSIKKHTRYGGVMEKLLLMIAQRKIARTLLCNLFRCVDRKWFTLCFEKNDGEFVSNTVRKKSINFRHFHSFEEKKLQNMVFI